MFNPSAKIVTLSARPSASVSSRTFTRSRPTPADLRGYSMPSVIQMRPRSSKAIAMGFALGQGETLAITPPCNISEPITPAVVEVSQLLVVHTQQVKHGRVKVVDADAVFHGLVADFVRLAVTHTAFDTRARHPGHE